MVRPQVHLGFYEQVAPDVRSYELKKGAVNTKYLFSLPLAHGEFYLRVGGPSELDVTTVARFCSSVDAVLEEAEEVLGHQLALRVVCRIPGRLVFDLPKRGQLAKPGSEEVSGVMTLDAWEASRLRSTPPRAAERQLQRHLGARGVDALREHAKCRPNNNGLD